MIASLSTPLIDEQSNCVNELFQAMLPQIRRQASIKLRHLRTEARDEALAEVVARAFCAGADYWHRAERKSPDRPRW